MTVFVTASRRRGSPVLSGLLRFARNDMKFDSRFTVHDSRRNRFFGRKLPQNYCNFLVTYSLNHLFTLNSIHDSRFTTHVQKLTFVTRNAYSEIGIFCFSLYKHKHDNKKLFIHNLHTLTFYTRNYKKNSEHSFPECFFLLKNHKSQNFFFVVK